MRSPDILLNSAKYIQPHYSQIGSAETRTGGPIAETAEASTTFFAAPARASFSSVRLMVCEAAWETARSHADGAVSLERNPSGGGEPKVGGPSLLLTTEGRPTPVQPGPEKQREPRSLRSNTHGAGDLGRVMNGPRPRAHGPDSDREPTLTNAPANERKRSVDRSTTNRQGCPGRGTSRLPKAHGGPCRQLQNGTRQEDLV